MLTLASTPDLENRLTKEAAKRGLSASDYALRLIEGLLQPDKVDAATDHLRLAAIDELMGAGADAAFSSADVRH